MDMGNDGVRKYIVKNHRPNRPHRPNVELCLLLELTFLGFFSLFQGVFRKLPQAGECKETRWWLGFESLCVEF